MVAMESRAVAIAMELASAWAKRIMIEEVDTAKIPTSKTRAGEIGGLGVFIGLIIALLEGFVEGNS